MAAAPSAQAQLGAVRAVLQQNAGVVHGRARTSQHLAEEKPQRCLRLRLVGTGRHARHDPDPPSIGRVERTTGHERRLQRQGHVEPRGIARQRSDVVPGQDADHGNGVPVERKRLAEDVRVEAELLLPHAVGDHRNRCRARPVVVERM